MGDELYQAVLERVRLVPNVQVRKDYFIPTATKLDLPDVEGNTTYNGYDVRCITAGEIIVGFDTRTERVKKFGFLPWGKHVEPLASLDDIRGELESVPEIGEPLAHNEHFLIYEKPVIERGSYGDGIRVMNVSEGVFRSDYERVSGFDLVVVGVGSFLGQHCEAIQQLDTGRYEWLKITTPFAADVKRAHVAAFGR